MPISRTSNLAIQQNPQSDFNANRANITKFLLANPKAVYGVKQAEEKGTAVLVTPPQRPTPPPKINRKIEGFSKPAEVVVLPEPQVVELPKKAQVVEPPKNSSEPKKTEKAAEKKSFLSRAIASIKEFLTSLHVRKSKKPSAPSFEQASKMAQTLTDVLMGQEKKLLGTKYIFATSGNKRVIDALYTHLLKGGNIAWEGEVVKFTLNGQHFQADIHSVIGAWKKVFIQDLKIFKNSDSKLIELGKDFNNVSPHITEQYALPKLKGLVDQLSPEQQQNLKNLIKVLHATSLDRTNGMNFDHVSTIAGMMISPEGKMEDIASIIQVAKQLTLGYKKVFTA